jgi:hypothetical protein
LEIYRRMLHVQDHWVITLQQEHIVGITTRKSFSGNGAPKAVRISDDAQQICGRP